MRYIQNYFISFYLILCRIFVLARSIMAIRGDALEEEDAAEALVSEINRKLIISPH